ncbi:MAG: hypothetical protein M0R77_17335 [Gammaproteobacteria bacterium]|nr:hypothetical protein [Gammaproteobacteria bacterium]
MPKVYDCFAFFNELDLLEIRLNELNPVVDYFVLVEATRTFQKEPKPLHFAENRSRFQQFAGKLIHVVVDSYPSFFTRFRIPTPMDYDNHQKNQIVEGLKNAQPDDIIIYSDLDEIPAPDKIREYRNTPGIKVFEQRLYSYFANCAVIDCPAAPELPKKHGHVRWRGSVMGHYRDFKDTKSFRKMRDQQEPSITLIEEGGWHFTYLGGLDSVLYKLNSFAHTKEKQFGIHDFATRSSLEKMLREGRDILGREIAYRLTPIDATLPEYLHTNCAKYPHLFREQWDISAHPSEHSA